MVRLNFAEKYGTRFLRWYGCGTLVRCSNLRAKRTKRTVPMLVSYVFMCNLQPNNAEAVLRVLKAEIGIYLQYCFLIHDFSEILKKKLSNIGT